MNSGDKDQHQAFVIAMVAATVAIAVMMVLGIGVWTNLKPAGAPHAELVSLAFANALPLPVVPVPQTAPKPISAAAPTALTDESDAATVQVESGVVSFYFAPASARLPPDAVQALQDVIAAARPARRLVITGFHDSTGEPLKNRELALQRAFAVRDILNLAGIQASQWVISKPVRMQGAESMAEARRVEVSVE